MRSPPQISMFNHTLAFSTQTKSLHDDIASCGFQSTVSVHLQHQKKLKTSCLRSADLHSFRDRCAPKTTCHWNENIEAKTKFYLAEEVLPAIGNGDITANPIVQVELIWSFKVQAVIKSWKVDGFPGHKVSRISRHYSVLCMKCLYIFNRKQ